MASVNGATCAMCIKSPAMLAQCSPGDYQQRIRRFKIKRPFNLKIDIDQKECSSIKGNWPALAGGRRPSSSNESYSIRRSSPYMRRQKGQRDQSQPHQQPAREHQPRLTKPRQGPGYNERIQNPAEAKAGDHQARNAGTLLADLMQERGDVRKDAKQKDAFHQHAAEAKLGEGISENQPVARRNFP